MSEEISKETDGRTGQSQNVEEPREQKIAKMYDKLFKKMLDDPTSAKKFLRKYLPPSVAALIGDAMPEQVVGHYIRPDYAGAHITPAYGDRYTDVLFRVPLTTGEDLFAYILVDHKSESDRWARLQLAGYLIDLLTDLKSKGSGRSHLPIIVPMIFYHGDDTWGHSTEFRELYPPVSADLEPYLLSFLHQLADFSRVPDEDLSDDPRLRAWLMLLKYIRSPMLYERTARILVIGREGLIIDELRMVIIAIRRQLGNDRFEAAMATLGPEYEEMKMDIMDILKKEIQEEEYEILRQQAEDARQEVERVRQEERERARQASQQLLMTLLEDRFGPLPDELRARIVAASADTLGGWTRKVGRAPDLDSVFA